MSTEKQQSGTSAGSATPTVSGAYADESYSIEARDVHFEWDGMPLHYIPGQPMAVHMYNAMHLVLPEGERAMSQALADALPYVEDPRLAEEIRGFIGQETQHADSHRGAREYLAEKGLNSETTASRMEWMVDNVLGYKKLTGRAKQEWLAERLGLFAAMEHYTAVVGEWFLTSNGLEENNTYPQMMDLLKWHGAEEVEHRNVVFDAFQYVDGSYARRVRTSFAASAILAVLFFSTARKLYKSDPELPEKREPWFMSLRRAIKANAMPSTKFFLTETPVYLRKKFHPSQMGNMDLAVRYLAQSPAVHHGEVSS
ncbi:metal-dependent hydrolase [Dietzia sp.]|uniref:metal-dependent hydrolase n=1 Tax=Dietzia sp. TaxID=1871616 RepID=UPI002FD96C60